MSAACNTVYDLCMRTGAVLNQTDYPALGSILGRTISSLLISNCTMVQTPSIATLTIPQILAGYCIVEAVCHLGLAAKKIVVLEPREGFKNACVGIGFAAFPVCALLWDKIPTIRFE